MRRRFGRGKRGRSSNETKSAPIDATRAFEQLIAAGVVTAPALEPAGDEDIAPGYAAVGTGEQDGDAVVVAYAPTHAGDALLAALAVAQRLAEDGFRGEAIAVAPQWNGAARQRLAAVGRDRLPYRLAAVANTALGDGRGVVEAGAFEAATAVAPNRVAARLARAGERALFERATQALEGLAAKHGGAVRGVGDSVELVVLARRVAAIRARESGVQLEVLEGERSTSTLAAESLATAMDQLEGLLRKRLNDKRVRGGEEGLRAQLGSSLAEVAGVRSARFWPVAGAEGETIDFIGVHDDGRPVVAAIRNRLTLAELGSLLDAALAFRPVFAGALADAPPPLRLDTPRLLLAAKEFDAAALRVLAALSLDHALYDVTTRRGRDPVLDLRDASVQLAASSAPAGRASSRGRASRVEEAPAEATGADAEAASDLATEGDGAGAEESGGRPRSRRRRGGRRPRGAAADAAAADESDGASGAGDGGGDSLDVDEISLFDLAEDTRASSDGGEGGSRRGRRGRGRRRRGRSGGDREAANGSENGSEDGDAVEASGGDDSGGEDRPSSRRRGRRRGRSASSESEDGDGGDDDIDELSEGLAPLEDLPELDEPAVPVYDDEEEDEDDRSRRRREAEDRARERDVEPEAEIEEAVNLARKRAGIVVHADRASLICGILLARDLRQIEGFWVYEQEDLMTFFRGVATDLREDTTIYVIGFMASPSRDAVQAASLYRGRLAWFDHHEWPPEDLGAMAEVIGKENLHVTPGAESPLAEVLAVRTRRSRFSDKVVELLTGSFSQHDYERWGRLWWHKLGEIAKRTGERRADVDPLLIGRPSDLAKQAALVPVPEPPSEVAFVAERDFRLVHFGGYTMVVVAVPEHLDPHLVPRIARERYGAEVSVAGIEGTDLVILAGEEGRDRRGLNLTGMVEHLVSKYVWVSELSAEDHVARMRIVDLAGHPERFDELVTEIAMGRSILDG